MATQHFFVGSRHLGSREIPTYRKVPGLVVKPHDSVAYFCPHCGEIWGRLLHSEATYTQCEHIPCRKHGEGRLSSLFPVDGWLMNYFEDDWPAAAVAYEFEAFLAAAETKVKNG